MSEQTTLFLDQKQVIHVQGSICFSNVVRLRQQGIEWMDATVFSGDILVDLQAVKQSDSSGLALLSSWMRAARQRHKNIYFINIPGFLSDLGRVSGLDSILPIKNS